MPELFYKIRFKLQKLEPHNYHIIANAKIAGHEVKLVLDTGASHTCFDMNFISSIQQNSRIRTNEGLNVGVGSSGFESKITTLYDFSIGKLHIPKYRVVLIDLQHINNAYASVNLPDVQGILGGDFFKKYRAVIDYQKRELMLRPFQSGL